MQRTLLKSKLHKTTFTGSAARLVQPGGRIIMAFHSQYEADEWAKHKPIKLLFDEQNSIVEWIDNV